MKKVAVVTVTYGKRGGFLKQVLESVAHDLYVETIIVVDNASKEQELLTTFKEKYGSKLVVLHEEKNTGSAGGFARGLEYARSLSVDYVFLLDDDNVPEQNAVLQFIDSMKKFEGRRIVLVGNRIDIGDESVFTSPSLFDCHPEKTFFSVFSFRKIKHLSARLLGVRGKKKKVPLQQYVPSRGFVYGGAFLPIEAIREAPLPDADLVLYGDDVEYSWGVYDAGYDTYLCYRPIIRDVDMTFEEGDHILGLFNSTTHLFKVYYRIRNMVRISRRNTEQPSIVLFLSVLAWVVGLFLFALSKQGPSAIYWSRVKLILRAVYDGYHPDSSVPKEAQLP